MSFLCGRDLIAGPRVKMDERDFAKPRKVSRGSHFQRDYPTGGLLRCNAVRRIYCNRAFPGLRPRNYIWWSSSDARPPSAATPQGPPSARRRTSPPSKENFRRGSAKVSSCNSKQPLLLASLLEAKATPKNLNMTDMCPSASVTMAYVSLGSAARFSSRNASIASLRRGAASSQSVRKEAMIRTSYEAVTALTFQLDQWGRLTG